MPSSKKRQHPKFFASTLFKQFTHHCKFPQSIFIFKKLLISPFYKPQSLIFPYLFKSCIVLRTPRLGFSIHGCLIKFGSDSNVVNSHSLISLYTSNRRIKDAYNVFDEMPERTVFSYDFLIFCLGANGFYEDVLGVFRESVGLGLCVNSDSVCYGIIACCEMRNLEGGISIHKLLRRNGIGSDVRADNLLISMYTKLGRMDLGRRVFDDMPERDLVSWNSMITGYAQNRNWVEVFDLFVNMKSMGDLIPSRVTFLGLVQACGQARNLNMGRSIHGFMIRPGLMSDFRLGTSILDMYLKCGEVESARFIFEEELHERSLVSWNSLLAGCAQNGCDLEAMSFFQNMLRDPNEELDSITIANVVPACARLTDLHMICSIHAIIIKKGLSLDGDIGLGTSMVDA